MNSNSASVLHPTCSQSSFQPVKVTEFFLPGLRVLLLYNVKHFVSKLQDYFWAPEE